MPRSIYISDKLSMCAIYYAIPNFVSVMFTFVLQWRRKTSRMALVLHGVIHKISWGSIHPDFPPKEVCALAHTGREGGICLHV